MVFSARFRAHARLAAVAAVICVLVAVQLYLYSPFHRHPQGRQHCSFNPVENGGGLEPGYTLAVAPPSLACCGETLETGRLAESRHIDQRPSRAPPA